MSIKNIITGVLLVILFSILSFYTVYKEPLNADDEIYKETFNDEQINVVKPARYNVELLDNKTDVTFKGERKYIENLKSQDPYLYAQAKEEEGEQQLLVNVKGLGDLGYDIEKETITAQVEEVEGRELNSKVVIKGDLEDDITIDGAEAKDEIIGYINEDVEGNISEIKVFVDAEDINNRLSEDEDSEEDEDIYEGEVKVEDKDGNFINKDIIEETDVDVEIKTRKE